jgi:hypothetical protein
MNYLGNWQCADDTEIVAEFRVIEKPGAENQMVLYYNEDTLFLDLKGNYITAELYILSIHDFYLLTGKGVLYTLIGFTTYTTAKRIGPGDTVSINGEAVRDAEPDSSEQDSWYDRIDEKIETLPGIRKFKRSSDSIMIVPFQKYAIELDEDTRIAIEPVID